MKLKWGGGLTGHFMICSNACDDKTDNMGIKEEYSAEGKVRSKLGWKHNEGG